jgi:hypothetical protein
MVHEAAPAALAAALRQRSGLRRARPVAACGRAAPAVRWKIEKADTTRGGPISTLKMFSFCAQFAAVMWRNLADMSARLISLR